MHYTAHPANIIATLSRSGARYLLSVSWAGRSSLALAWLSRDGAELGVELCTIASSPGPAQCRQVAHYAQYTQYIHYTSAQWAKPGFFVQWVYWVYSFSQNTLPLCNAAMHEQV